MIKSTVIFALGIILYNLGATWANHQHTWKTINGTRVVGGQSAQCGELPYQIALYLENTLICGGSLIKVRVLTAAHCFLHSTNPASYIVSAGEIARDNLEGQVRRVVAIKRHANYVPQIFFNDIAILVIDHPFQINKLVSPIRLPNCWEHVGANGLLSGWGLLNESGDYAPVLQKARIPILNDSDCEAVFPFYVASRMICAGAQSGTCEGDSGGPLRDDSKGFLAGIVSFGKTRCTSPESHGVYTRVSAYRQWIDETVAELPVEIPPV